VQSTAPVLRLRDSIFGPFRLQPRGYFVVVRSEGIVTLLYGAKMAEPDVSAISAPHNNVTWLNTVGNVILVPLRSNHKFGSAAQSLVRRQISSL